MADKIVNVHIGARAHYLFPKALQKKNKLSYLLTDTWIQSSQVRHFLKAFPQFVLNSLAGRYSRDIPSDKVLSFGTSFLLYEVYLRVKYKNAWQRIIARNKYFEKAASGILKKVHDYTCILGISYTSLEVFKYAKQQGKKAVLFQIDPAIEEEMIVERINTQYSHKFATEWQKAPPEYWESWKQECDLADVIIANSTWSKEGLVKHGVKSEKIRIIPLPIDIKPAHLHFSRHYPETFTKERPLRCLFLGTLTLRKGIHIVLEVAEQLQHYPIEFILIGNSELIIDFKQYPNVSYKGVVSREETDDCYKQADIFLFPTLSDGFGLTQLEAMSWQLPVIASKHCGEVVVHEHNGFVLQENTTAELIEVLHRCLQHPALLSDMAHQSFKTAEENNVDNFADQLIKVL